MLSLEVVTLLSSRKETVVFHLARVSLQLTVVSRTLGLSNVMSLDVLNTPSVEFHFPYCVYIYASAIIEEHITSTCTSACGVNKLEVLSQLAVEL